MRWQLTGISGTLGAYPAAAVLGHEPPEPDPGGRRLVGSEPDAHAACHKILRERLQPLLDSRRLIWVILSNTERARRDWWQAQLGSGVEVGFGRASVALALSQLNRMAVPGRLIAAHRPADSVPGIAGELGLDWTPSKTGLAFEFNRMDGRIDGKADVGALLELGRKHLEKPEAFFCPGTGGGGNLDRLLPFLAQLGPWAGREVRWEFPEAAVGELGVVGSLFNWAWIEAGYRLGDWTGPCAVLELDESPLAGLSLISWAHPDFKSPA